MYLAYLDLVGNGRWAPSAEEAASRDTAHDNGRALRVADAAAKAAAVAALEPLVEAAREELVAATAERDSIVRRQRF